MILTRRQDRWRMAALRTLIVSSSILSGPIRAQTQQNVPRPIAVPDCTALTDTASAKSGAEIFDIAFCHFHNVMACPPTANGGSCGDSNSRVNQTLAQFGEAQTKGLPTTTYQETASLFAALLQCRQLENLTATGSGVRDFVQICNAKQDAQYALSRVNWGMIDIDYPATSKFQLRDWVEKAGACVQKINSERKSECEEAPPVSDASLEKIATDEAERLTSSNLYKKGPAADGRLAYLDGLFGSKVAEINTQVTELNTAVTGKNGTEAKVEDVNKTITNLVQNTKTLESIGARYESYKTLVKQAHEIISIYDSWATSLNEDPVVVNAMKVKTASQSNREQMSKAELVTQKFEEAFKSLQQPPADLGKKLCIVYFCGMLDKKSLAKTATLCGSQAMKNNPLCIWKPGVGDSYKMIQGTTAFANVCDAYASNFVDSNGSIKKPTLSCATELASLRNP